MVWRRDSRVAWTRSGLGTGAAATPQCLPLTQHVLPDYCARKNGTVNARPVSWWNRRLKSVRFHLLIRRTARHATVRFFIAGH